jgi:predicted nucleic acid-binding protein
MNRVFVVDASVAAKWLLKEDLTDQAIGLLDETRYELWAPDYVLTEVYNILCKKVRRRELTEHAALQLAEDLAGAPINIRDFIDYLDLALRLALKYSQAVYDCIYLAMATQMGCALVTADQIFARAVRHTQEPTAPLTEVVWLGSLG